MSGFKFTGKGLVFPKNIQPEEHVVSVSPCKKPGESSLKHLAVSSAGGFHKLHAFSSTVPHFPKPSDPLSQEPVILGQNYFVTNGIKYSRLKKKPLRRSNSVMIPFVRCDLPDRLATERSHRNFLTNGQISPANRGEEVMYNTEGGQAWGGLEQKEPVMEDYSFVRENPGNERSAAYQYNEPWGRATWDKNVYKDVEVPVIDRSFVSNK